MARTRTDLTDRTLQALKPDPDGKLYDVMDAEVKGLGVRVLGANKNPTKDKDSPKAQMSFILVARFPGSRNPTRRAMGEYQTDLTLDEARDKARGWKRLIEQGKDPKDEEERQRRDEARKRQFTVAAVAKDFFAEKLPSERKGREVERDLRRDFLSALGDRPITDIERSDIRKLVKAKARTAPAQARNLLGYIKRFFSWALDEEYGLKVSPCSDLKARTIIGPKPAGERHLSDDELAALWRATRCLPYPYRQIYQLLALTALRLNEVADASKSEFEYGAKMLWTLPGSRMKARNGKARPHVVPLTTASLHVLGSLPDQAGPYLFSVNGGKSPVWVTDKIKRKLDGMMLRILRAMARKRGEDPRQVKLEHFTNHDIRRSVRTALSPLKNSRGEPIADEVKEAILAHVRPGVKGVYDKYQYLDEKLEVLVLWASRLDQIVAPAPRPRPHDNVVSLSGRRR